MLDSQSDQDFSRRIALVLRALTTDVGPAEIIDIVVNQGMAGMGADGCHAGIVQGDYLHPVAAIGISVELVSRFGAFTLDRTLPVCLAATTGEPVWVSTRPEGLVRFPDLVAASPTACAWAALPLRAGGRTFGAFGLSFQRPVEFDAYQRSCLGALVDGASLALSRWSAAPSASTTLTSDPVMAELDRLMAIARLEGVVVIDAAGQIARVNGRLCEMFGYSPDQLLGQPLEILLPERDAASHVQKRRQYLSEPGPRPMGGGATFEGRHAAGATFPIDVSLSPCATSHGLYVVAVVRAERAATPDQSAADDISL